MGGGGDFPFFSYKISINACMINDLKISCLCKREGTARAQMAVCKGLSPAGGKTARRKSP